MLISFLEPISESPQTPQTPETPQSLKRSATVHSSPLVSGARTTPLKRVLPFPTSTGSMKRTIDDKIFDSCPETSRFFSSTSDKKRAKVEVSAKGSPTAQRLTAKEAFAESPGKTTVLDSLESNKENIDPNKLANEASSSSIFPLEAFRHRFVYDGLKDSELNRRRSMPAFGEKRAVPKTPSLRSRKSFNSAASSQSSQGFDSASQTLDSIISKSSPESNSGSMSMSFSRSGEWPEFVATGRKTPTIGSDPFERMAARNFR